MAVFPVDNLYSLVRIQKDGLFWEINSDIWHNLSRKLCIASQKFELPLGSFVFSIWIAVWQFSVDSLKIPMTVFKKRTILLRYLFEFNKEERKPDCYGTSAINIVLMFLELNIDIYTAVFSCFSVKCELQMGNSIISLNSRLTKFELIGWIDYDGFQQGAVLESFIEFFQPEHWILECHIFKRLILQHDLTINLKSELISYIILGGFE